MQALLIVNQAPMFYLLIPGNQLLEQSMFFLHVISKHVIGFFFHAKDF
jgi:hypothetical protein